MGVVLKKCSVCYRLRPIEELTDNQGCSVCKKDSILDEERDFLYPEEFLKIVDEHIKPYEMVFVQAGCYR
jgi:hypothetical protein